MMDSIHNSIEGDYVFFGIDRGIKNWFDPEWALI